MNKKKIIAFAGRKRSGKGMLAKGIKEYSDNVVIVTIADNLKFLCCKLLNRTYDELNQMKDDGTIFEEKVDGTWVSIINKETNINEEIIYKEIGERIFTNVREVLQVIGTDLIRKYVPDWHIDKTIKRIKAYDEDKIIVVDDVRFPNEKCKIESIGGDVYFVIRPNNWDVSNHPSEIALSYDDFKSWRVIINDLPKDEMIKHFNDYYFNSVSKTSRNCPILLSSNDWYLDSVMDTTTHYDNFDYDRKYIARYVIEQNIKRPQFLNNGVITFTSANVDVLNLFRKIIIKQRPFNDYCSSYAIYNPLTNEVLKNFM